MEAGFIIIAIVLCIAGAVIVALLSDRARKKQQDTQGMLNIVYDDFGGSPQLVLALYDPVETVVGQKQVLFDVNIIHQNSQK